MRSIAAFQHLMSTTVSIAPRSSLNSYGEPTFGTDETFRAHLSRKRRIVR